MNLHGFHFRSPDRQLRRLVIVYVFDMCADEVVVKKLKIARNRESARLRINRCNE